MRRQRHRGFDSVYRAASGEQDATPGARGLDDARPPGAPSLSEALASRRPRAIDTPLSPETSPRPAAQSAALASAVAGQQDAAGPSNASTVAPAIPPAPAAALVPPPPRAYPMPAPGGPPPVSGFWGGGPRPPFYGPQGGPVPPDAPPMAPGLSGPPVPQAAVAAPNAAFQQAGAQYGATVDAGGTVDTSAWTPEDFQAAAAATGNYYNPMMVGPPGSAQANSWAASQVSQQRHPVDQAAQAQRAAENNALRAAQTASMGQLVAGPGSTPVANPAETAARFAQSGYTGAQALADGWGSGTGRNGWEALPGWSNPLDSQGRMGAPYVNQGATPAAPNADPYHPAGYTPGAAASPPAPSSPPPASTPSGAPSGTIVDTQQPQQSAPPVRPPSMRPLSSYFHGLNKAAGG